MQITFLLLTKSVMAISRSVDIHGRNRHLVTHAVERPLSLTIYEEYIYWTSNWINERLERINRFTGQDRSIIFNSSRDIPTMRVNHPSRQPSGQYYYS